MSIEKSKGKGGDSAAETTGNEDLKSLLGRLAAKAEPDADIAGQPYYDTPDGSSPIDRAIWDRLNIDTVGQTVDQINRMLASDSEARNGHLELENLFVVNKDEKEALAGVAGSALVRDVVDLVLDVERAVTLAEAPSLPADVPPSATRGAKSPPS